MYSNAINHPASPNAWSNSLSAEQKILKEEWHTKKKTYLVGGLNPSEKDERQLG